MFEIEITLHIQNKNNEITRFGILIYKLAFIDLCLRGSAAAMY